MHHHLHLLTLLVATAVTCQWVANRLQIPAIILLLGAGIALGPVTGVLDPGLLFGDLLHPFVALAVAVILFEGGLSLNLSEARAAGNALWRLLLSGLVVGFALVAVAGVFIGGLTPGTAAVLGGILVVTGPTVIIPMLRTARIARRPATLLKWEGIVNDPLGALLAILVFQLAAETAAPTGGTAAVAGRFVSGAVASAAIGVAVGWLLEKMLDRGWLAEHLKSPVMLGAVLAVYTLAELVGEESGLLAVTAMGLLLANVKNPHVEDIRHFKEQVSTLLIGLLFVTLSASLQLEDLERLVGPPLLLVLFILVVARPVVAALGTLGTEMPWQERALLAWIAPRGVVAAAVAGAFEPRLLEAGYRDAELLVPIVFGVIMSTVILHSLTIRPMARRLGLSTGGSGILIVGGARWVLQLALALRRAGAEVVMTDTAYRRVSRARREGLEVHFGDVLSEEMEYELPLERISWVFAANDDAAYNSLVCMRFASSFGRSHVLQLAPPKEGRKDSEHGMMGRVPWGDHVSYYEITHRYWNDATFKVTALSPEFTWEMLRERNPGALFLFYVRQGKLGVIEDAKAPPDDAKVLFLSDPTQPEAEEVGGERGEDEALMR